MNVPGHLSPDGTVQVLCPQPGCAAKLRVKPKSARTWVTCAANGCGHRFVLEVSDFKDPPPAGSTPPLPFPPPLRAKESFGVKADDRPEPPNRADRPIRGPRREEAAGSGNTALLVGGGIAAFLIVAGGVAAAVMYAMRDKGDGPLPGPVVQNQTTTTTTVPAPAGFEAVKPKDNPIKPKAATTGVKRAAAPKEAVEAEADPDDPPTPSEAKGPKKKGPAAGPGRPIPSDARAALAKVKKSTALIESKDGWGTGFVIRPGIVMTNNHVISGIPLDELKVSFVSVDDTAPAPLKPTLLYCDPRRDLAILRVETDRPPLDMCPSGTELTGLEVAVVGNPRGDGGQAQVNKVTTGSLSSPVRRNAEWTYYELRAEAFFGNSGGPVVDLKTGKLVGVMQSILGDGRNKSYCIPYGEAMRALDRLPASLDKEPEAIKIAAGRHAVDFIKAKLPVIEDNASVAMELQLNILEHGPRNVGSRLKDGRVFQAADVMTALKETHGKTYAQLKKLADGPIAASPEMPSALRSAVRVRLEKCEGMRQLAASKTETKNAFVAAMHARQAESDKAVHTFHDEYDKFLSNMDKAKGK
jgi:S1-C subfamily serine protease